MTRLFTFVLSLVVFSVTSARLAFASTTVDADAYPYLVFGGIAVGLACFGGGLLLVKNGRDRRRIGQVSGHWPLTDGKILAADVARKSHPTSGVYHVPRVRYSYAVAGKQYEGGTICPGIEQFGLGSELQARARIDRYPVGATVPVHYDPFDPSSAVLEPTEIGGGRNIFGGAIVVALGVFIFGLAIAIGALGTD